MASLLVQGQVSLFFGWSRSLAVHGYGLPRSSGALSTPANAVKQRLWTGMGFAMFVWVSAWPSLPDLKASLMNSAWPPETVIPRPWNGF